MKKLSVVLLLLTSMSVFGANKADPLLASFWIDRAEVTAGDSETGLAWEIDSWLGKDLNKLRWLSEGERADGKGAGDSRLLYSRAVSPFWDGAIGWRREFADGDQWDALALEAFGTLPYFIETEAGLAWGENGQTLLWASLEQEWSFGSRSPRWMLVPEVEAKIYGKDQPLRGVGSGLSSLELGLRMHYEIKPDLSPYAGVTWERKFGDSADYAKTSGEDSSELRWVLGLTLWF